MGRLIRFGLTGLVTTAIAYGVFLALLRLGVYYLAASAAAWAASMVVGFAINRRFTFGIAGADGYRRDFGVYALGAVLQLLLGLADYRLLMGNLRMDPTPAFVINLCLTTTFSFLFLRFVTFRRAVVP